MERELVARARERKRCCTLSATISMTVLYTLHMRVISFSEERVTLSSAMMRFRLGVKSRGLELWRSMASERDIDDAGAWVRGGRWAWLLEWSALRRATKKNPNLDSALRVRARGAE